MIFPQVSVTTQATSPVEYGSEINFDFENEVFVLKDGEPEILYGIDALKMWIEKAIRTARYRWPVYSWSYGSEIEDLIGKSLGNSVTQAEIKRYISEALIYDNRISIVQGFTFNQTGGEVTVTFEVTTFADDALEVVAYV
jgi:phage baseplate assembly protein W